MKIHEYQARGLLADQGIPVPPGRMVECEADAVAEAKHLFDGGSALVVVKADGFAPPQPLSIESTSPTTTLRVSLKRR